MPGTLAIPELNGRRPIRKTFGPVLTRGLFLEEVEVGVVVDEAVGGVRGWIAVIGPGIAIAATGVGAGDMVAAAVAGSRFGYAVVWAALVGALLKLVLNEGVARWQLATGTTLLEGWTLHLGRWVQWLFLAYLVVWSFVVGGALRRKAVA